MTKVLTDEQNYYDIADAIRGKLDVETLYLPSEMAAAIDDIQTGTELTSEDEGKVVVEDAGSYVLAGQTSLAIAENGTYDTTTNDEVVVSVSGGGTLIPDDSLLFHFDDDFSNCGKDGAAAFSVSGMAVSNEQSKFGGKSLKFLGSQSIDNIYLGSEIVFGTNDFTLDFWFYPTALSSSAFQTVLAFDYRSLTIYVRQGALQVGVSSNRTGWYSVEPIENLSIDNNSWYHVAVVRDGANIYVYLNGTKVKTISYGSSTIIASITKATLGSNTSSSGALRFSGYMDELRLRIGEAVWTSDFTPPTEPYRGKEPAVLVPKSITQNGTYDPADDDADGYDSVTVNVSGGGYRVQEESVEYTLPSEYQEVEYVGFDGYCYITVPRTDYATMFVKATDESTDNIVRCVAGFRASSTKDFDWNARRSSDGNVFWTRSGYCGLLNYDVASNGVRRWWIGLSNNHLQAYIGKYYTYSSGGSAWVGKVYKAYSVKLSYSAEKSFEWYLVPCYRKADDVIGFYDVINDSFYTNDGSGTFTKGNDV